MNKELTCNEDCKECNQLEDAKISPIMVMGSENRGILNAASYILKLYQREKEEKYELKLKEMVPLFSQIERHYKKKEDLFLPIYSSYGFKDKVDEQIKQDNEILNLLKVIQEKDKTLSPYDYKNLFLDFCTKIVLLAKEENTNLLVYCFHNFTQDEMDEIGKKIPSYDYTFLSIKPKPEDLVSHKCSD